jgi:uncharacterized iron-regulated membrane protein
MTSLERLLLVSALALGGLVVFLIVVGVVLHRARRLAWRTTWRHLLTALITMCAGAVVGAIVSGIAGFIMTPFMPSDQIRALIIYTTAVGAAFGGFWAAVRMLAVRKQKCESDSAPCILHAVREWVSHTYATYGIKLIGAYQLMRI